MCKYTMLTLFGESVRGICSSDRLGKLVWGIGLWNRLGESLRNQFGESVLGVCLGIVAGIWHFGLGKYGTMVSKKSSRWKWMEVKRMQKYAKI